MGGAIARGLSTCDLFRPQDITVINRRASKTAEIQGSIRNCRPLRATTALWLRPTSW